MGGGVGGGMWVGVSMHYPSSMAFAVLITTSQAFSIKSCCVLSFTVPNFLFMYMHTYNNYYFLKLMYASNTVYWCLAIFKILCSCFDA